MSQRKLSKQQKKRIESQQEQIRQDAQQDDNSQSGIVIQAHGKQVIVETAPHQLMLCNIRQNLGNIVCGDEVIVQQDEAGNAVITAVQPRRSVLARPDFHRKPKPFAANLDQIILVFAVQPEISLHLLDRYLIITEMLNIDRYIVINKMDLIDESLKNKIREQMQVYENLGYELVFTSVKSGQGMQALTEILTNKRSILVGQSGVGKSSLANALLPDMELQTGELNQARLGKHTTSVSTLYHLPDGGDIIDSPGVRQFGIWHITLDDIQAGFRELVDLAGECRFHNCRHINEPGCAVIAAVENQELSKARYDSYVQMLNEMDESSS